MQPYKLNTYWIIEGVDTSFRTTDNTIPISVHSALMRNNIIDDIYFRNNDLLYSFIPQYDWTFYNNFQFNPQTNQKYFVVLDQIDTLSDVYINDSKVGETKSMFISYKFEITEYIKQGNNCLKIIIKSPIKYTYKKYKEINVLFKYIMMFHSWNEPNNRIVIRKTQSDFGWDWGPSFTPMGIYGDVKILSESQNNRVNNFFLHYQVSDDLKSVEFDVNLDSEYKFENVNIEINYELLKDDSNKNQQENTIVKKNMNINKGLTYIQSVKIENVMLWYPLYSGPQTMYKISVKITKDNESYILTRNYGFRKARIVTDKRKCSSNQLKDPLCKSFYFEINNKSYFSKGSNMVPMDALKDRTSLEKFKFLVDSSINANMNMIRIWGGGYYLEDSWYDYLDQKGIMVWQEFTFACGMYPIEDEFLNLVAIEVRQQSLRLNNHPSIVVFGGNNENEEANIWFKEYDKNIYIILYRTVYNNLFIYNKYNAEWLDSSPSIGFKSIEVYEKHWQKPTDDAGDVHFYSNEYCLDTNNIPKSRFISEYGLDSTPSYYEYLNVFDELDFKTYSPVHFYRLKANGGYEHFMNSQMDKHIHIDALKYVYKDDDSYFANQQPCDNEIKGKYPKLVKLDQECLLAFRRWLWLTQLNQALCYQRAFGYWRSLQRTDYNTMGVLYWQLNDVWQGPSWSTMEYSLRPRASYYQVKNTFNYFIIFNKNNDLKKLDLELVIDEQDINNNSDYANKLDKELYNQELTLEIKIFRMSYKSHNLLKTENIKFSIKSDSKLYEAEYPGQNSIAIINVYDQNENVIYYDTMPNYKLNYNQTPRSSIQIISVTKLSEYGFKVVMKSEGLSLYTYLETPEVGYFDHSLFSMVDSETRSIVFTSYNKLGNKILLSASCYNCGYKDDEYVLE